MKNGKKQSPYTLGYESAYGATSWTLSGQTFNAAEEAERRAERANLAGEARAAFVRGFVDWCREHAGAWTATE